MFARLKNQGFTSFKSFSPQDLALAIAISVWNTALTFFLLLWQTLNFQILAKTSLIQ